MEPCAAKSSNVAAKRFVLLALALNSACTLGPSERANNAYVALKKLEAKTETGINYRDYGKEMGETWFAVKGYLESPSANKEPEISQALAEVMRKYNFAAQLWTWNMESKRDFPKDAVCEKLDYRWKYRKENIEKELPDAIKPRESGGAMFKEYPPGSSPVDCIDYRAALQVAWSNASKELKKASAFFH